MADVNALAARGIKLLLGRQLALLVLTFAGGIVLARLLTPAEFGLYFIAMFFVETTGLLAGFGLVPFLIQRHAPPTDRDIAVAFTMQTALAFAAGAALFAAAPAVAALYPDAPSETAWLVRALAVTLVLTSWRALAALQLERKLSYGRLAWIEVAETTVFQVLAVLLATAGYGVWSLAIAALARSVVGTVATYAAAPWRVALAVDRGLTREMLRFGLPFQLQTVAHHGGSWITPLFVGALVGPHAVGLLTWASSNARKPLLLVDNVMRVGFPHFSRLQHDGAEVTRMLDRYLTFLLLAVGLWLALIGAAGSRVVPLVYTDAWSPAVPALVVFAAALTLDVVLWVVGVTLNALGRPARTTAVVVARTGIFVAAAIPLVLALGFNGAAIAYLVASACVVPWLVRALGVGAPRRLLATHAWILVPTAASGAAGFVVLRAPLPDAATLPLSLAAVVLVYAAICRVAAPAWLVASATAHLPGMRPRRSAAAQAAHAEAS